MGEPGRVISVDDVEEVQLLLRRRDPAARQLALAVMKEWQADSLDSASALALVRVAAAAHPSIGGTTACPSETAAQLLWDRPELVDANDVLGAYAESGERVRRAWLHLLALQRSDDALAALAVLLGEDTPEELVPRPRGAPLLPLLGHPSRERVLELLCVLLGRLSWVRHAAELLLDAVIDAPVRDAAAVWVRVAVTSSAGVLVDACDRAAVADPQAGDLARNERVALGQLVAVIDLLDDVTAAVPELWWRLLSSADPRVGALGAVRLVRAGEEVAPERLVLLARDPIARVELHEGLAGVDPVFLPEGLAGMDAVTDSRAVAEGRLVRWLADPVELGRAPDEIEHLRSMIDPDGERWQFFRFRLNAPHWSSARGWMIGATSRVVSGSVYRAEDECDLVAHARSIHESLTQWPESRGDGAA